MGANGITFSSTMIEVHDCIEMLVMVVEVVKVDVQDDEAVDAAGS